MVVAALLLLAALVLYIIILIRPSFGSAPSGASLQRLRESGNYRKGSFHNSSETQMMTGSLLETLREFVTSKDTRPRLPLPSVKAPLPAATDQPELVWFGHSSYLLYIGGKTILVDPVFSANASPVPGFAGSFGGTGVYTVADLPEIDLVLITHDHYDHLDHATIVKLLGKAKRFCAPLGVGSHLRYWGVSPEKIQELDWWQSVSVLPGVQLTAAPARHFSGRGISRNKTLWASYILEAEDVKLYIGGDSGYDSHFRTIGEKHGPFDLVMLECGQYDRKWKYIHMMPEETVQACVDLKGRVLLPVHWGKFTLAVHPWSDPVQRALKKADELNVTVTTPLIGERVTINGMYPSTRWWEL
jgi:L-ascorbate metabolism protein UlaG (beta-lactamase superfamily)